MRFISIMALAAARIAVPAHAADEAEAEAPVTVLAQSADAAAEAHIGPICTDRPTKATAACTVPEGMVQIETDLFFWTRNNLGPVQSDVLLYTNPTIKYGLGPNTDIQANIAPVVEVRNEVGGLNTSQTGVGDLFVRLKQRLTGPDSPVQVAIVPFVKVPTAELGIGNREWEGGVTGTVQVPVGAATLSLVPSFNLLADALDPGDRHIEFQGIVNLAFPVAERTGLAMELWTSQRWDPAGTVRQYSADAALTYLVNDDLQLDIGGNFGLDQATPDLQLYVGLSTRF
ncbi:MAG: transporter [Novosphingobium sp.]